MRLTAFEPVDSPLLLDLAVLYRALTFGADGDLDPAEADAMRAVLEAWVPGQDPARIDHVLREAALVDARRVALESALERVSRGLGASERARVLADLRRLAQADGRVTEGEESFLAHVEEVLGR